MREKGQRKWIRGVVFGVGVVIALLFGMVSSSLAQNPSPNPLSFPDVFRSRSEPTELRGVWLTNIDSGVLFSQADVAAGLERLAQLNFNTAYPTVWNWGYTLYPSTVAERVIGEAIDPHPALEGRDVLAETINMGHQQGLSVVPWFEFGLMTPSYSALARRHPDWLTARQDGSTVVMQGRHPRKWLNPLRPEVRQFLVEMMTEVVTRYDVDGIQMDDHFGLPVELGYDSYTIAQYRTEHDGDAPPDDPQDEEWVRWRADKITELMGQIVAAVKARKPDCFISLSPNPHPYAYQYFLQDWATWLENGWLDEVIVQVYRNGMEAFVQELEQPQLQAMKDQVPVGIGILTGLKNRPTPFELIQDQVEAVRDRHYAGVSFFFYESLGDRDASFQSLFDESARRPAPASQRVDRPRVRR